MFVLASLAALISPPGPPISIVLGSDAPACPDGAPPACEAARLALADAQSEVQAAAARKALWTTAADALNEAQARFLKGDYAAANRAAHTAIEHSRLGIAQIQYPRFPLPSP
ncbi:MAG TPA: hypothetical protein VMH26_05150 [Burkholderiales bacterium]|nr:hypothetical protein [Burkholderiales bacterium]